MNLRLRLIPKPPVREIAAPGHFYSNAVQLFIICPGCLGHLLASLFCDRCHGKRRVCRADYSQTPAIVYDIETGKPLTEGGAE